MPFMKARDVVTYLPVEAISGVTATEDSVRNMLATLDLQETLIFCARLNAIISGLGTASMEDRIRKAVAFLGLPRQERRIRDLLEPSGYGTFRVFFRGQLLELMRLALKYCSRDPLPGCYAFAFNRKQFFKTALIASKIWSDRISRPEHNVGALSPENIGEHIGYLRKMAEDTNPAPDFGSSMGRGWLLFSEVLPRHYPSFKEEFLEATGMTFDQYFTCTCGLMTYVSLGNEMEGRTQNINTVGAATRYRGVFPHYMAVDAQAPEELAKASAGTQADFERAMWQRPVIRFANDATVIADPVVFSAKLSIGPLFVPLRGHPERSKALFAAFGDAFEEYSSGILRRMFSNAHFNLKKMKGKKVDFEVDALIAQEGSAFVFETKAKFLKEELISGNAYAGFVEHLRERYVSRGNAVWQLEKIVTAISAGTWATIPAEFGAMTRIFPIVLTHDTRMDTPGTGMFLDQEMKRLNPGIRQDSRVQPLIVLTIRDLEMLEGSIASGQLSLTELLSGYLAELTDVDPLCSFYNYVAHSRYGGQMQPSATVREKALEVLDRAKEVLFPEGQGPQPADTIAGRSEPNRTQ
jgi:hypothetical protein